MMMVRFKNGAKSEKNIILNLKRRHSMRHCMQQWAINILNLETIIAWNMNEAERKKMKRTTMLIKNKDKFTVEQQWRNNSFSSRAFFSRFLSLFAKKKGSSQMKWHHKRQMNASLLYNVIKSPHNYGMHNAKVFILDFSVVIRIKWTVNTQYTKYKVQNTKITEKPTSAIAI